MWTRHILILLCSNLIKANEVELRSKESTPPVLRCGSSKIDIDVPKIFLQKHNIIVKDSSELHFAKHKDCFAVDNGDSYKLQIFSPFDSCGTTVEHGSDDYAYTNEVVFENKDRTLSVFQFRCIYEDKYIVSSGPISPTKRTLQFHSGEGEFEVSMEMYRGPSFSFMDKHADNPTVRLNDPVYVDVEFTSNLGFGDPGRDLVTTVKTCYATDTPNHANHQRYHNLISGMCVSPEDASVEILENGNSDNARFKFNMFKWKGVIAYIYLHCEVHLCNNTIETCRNDQKMCHNRNQKRKRRGIKLPNYLNTQNKKSRITRQINQSRKYTIEADMGEYDDIPSEVGESILEYSMGDISNNNDAIDYTYHDDIHGMLDSSFYDLPEEEEMTDFITRGPILFDDDESVGSGQINSTIIEIKYNDEFLRVYIFSSIAIVICIIAMILAILLALKRRKTSLEKMADIDHVFNGFNTRQSIDGSYGGSGNGGNLNNISQKASITTGISSYENFNDPSGPGKILPAITGLPLPPTPVLTNLPPVLGSPVTTASNVSNSNNSNITSDSEIYHNIQAHGNHQLHHQSSHTHQSPQLQFNPQVQRTTLQKAESSRLHSRPTLTLPPNGNRVERSKTSIHPNNRQPQFMTKKQQSHSYNMGHNHVNNKGVNVNTNGLKHSHSQLVQSVQGGHNRKVETNTISHTLSNYSN